MFLMLRARRVVMEMLAKMACLVPKGRKDPKDPEERKDYQECRETL